ncbi:MAG TPA: hypothetical protein PLL30_14310 [Candidatus Krumholzibacteria bacterium]|nr:hypothetical protein [Candidatus Krumholzibacteria bacterium]HPD72940.1 hypothetical protein [Candidatus Krumholzibacteria bacterium]HRY41739.1 hypothetical protein [Candidatus Krumholzibacteria bacterium]
MSNGTMTREQRRQLFRRRVRDSLRRADDAFRGEYKAEIDALIGLSRDEIDAITPDTTDLQTYDALITVVKEASRINLAQADLKAQILEMGEVAVAIAGRVPGLARLLV